MRALGTTSRRERPTPPTTRSGGRSWWAHLQFTRINIEPIILKNKMEELMNVKGIGEKSFLKLKPLITVTQTPQPSPTSAKPSGQ